MLRYHTEIPAPPSEFLYTTLEEVRSKAREVTYFENVYGSFQLHDRDLEDFFRPYFSFDITNRIGYQYIGPDIVVHKDVGRVETYNFITNPGGDNVVTTWYEDDRSTVIRQETIKANVWHNIKVDRFHDVKNIKSPRIMMMVFEEAKTPNFENQ